MALSRQKLRLSLGVALTALVVVAVPSAALAGPLANIPAPAEIVFYTPIDTQVAPVTAGSASPVHLLLGAGKSVAAVQVQYSTDQGAHWQNINGVVPRGTLSDVFDTTWTTTLTGPVELQAVGYDAVSNGTVIGTSTPETVTLSTTSGTSFGFTRPAPSSDTMLGLFKRADGRWYAGVLGTTSGSTAPSAVDAANPDSASTSTTTTSPAPASTLAAPTGVFTPATTAGGLATFAEPVDLSAYLNKGSPLEAAIRVSDGISSDAVEASLYTQVVTAVRATSTKVAGTSNVAVTATVTDQYGLPVVGAPVRLSGHQAGTGGAGLNQLGITNAVGQVTFTGPGAGTGPVTPTGYPTGGYLIYTDLDLNGAHGAKEPSFAVIAGTVSFEAPGRAFYHNDTPIKTAGGIYGDSVSGTHDAHVKGYTWIDQDGQLAYATHKVLVGGISKVTSSSQLVWVNAHGAPYNPSWLKKTGRFESHSWSSISSHQGLRDLATTLRQDARNGLSVEWEVKDVKPFTTAAALKAAFANLVAAAKRYYGTTWASQVQVKVLTNLSGGQAYALKVLQYAHAAGFTTILLARGASVKTQIPASAQKYVTYVRGAAAGLYASVPSATQATPVVSTTPKSRG